MEIIGSLVITNNRPSYFVRINDLHDVLLEFLCEDITRHLTCFLDHVDLFLFLHSHHPSKVGADVDLQGQKITEYHHRPGHKSSGVAFKRKHIQAHPTESIPLPMSFVVKTSRIKDLICFIFY